MASTRLKPKEKLSVEASRHPVPAPPLLSIITVTLNPGKLLEDTLLSIEQQDMEGCEWIIKDAGSSDGSIDETVRAFNRYPTKILVQPDKGVYDGMNQALAEASGRYVHFLNAGDRYASPTALTHVFLANSERSEQPSTLLYTFYQDLGTQAIVTYPATLGSFFLYRSNICHQAQFILRSAFSEIGIYDITYPICADREMLTRLLLRLKGKARRIPLPVVVYHGRGISAKQENLPQRDREHRAIEKAYFSRFQILAFESVKFLTFARVRARIVDDGEQTPATRAYFWLRNLIRRWI